jgi:hypothetical protein
LLCYGRKSLSIFCNVVILLTREQWQKKNYLQGMLYAGSAALTALPKG